MTLRWKRAHGLWMLPLGIIATQTAGCEEGQVGSDTTTAAGAGGGAATSGAGGEGEGGAPPPPSDNPIDVAIWPRMVAEGKTEIVLETPERLCRRMALDFAGRTPSATDVAERCTGKTPAEMADAWMGTGAFLARERKLWIQHLRLDPEKVLADHLVEADGYIESFARGELGYDDFAAKLLAHPSIAILWHLDDAKYAQFHEEAADTAFRVFLGRAASFSEQHDAANLFRVWRRGWVPRYTAGDYPPEVPNGLGGYGYYVHIAELDPGACTDPVFGEAACTSTLLGATTTVSPDLSGLPLTSGRVLYEAIQGAVPDDVQTELEKVGYLFASRPEFWDEAADHSMSRLLGWWKSSVAEPDTVLPEVRAALASWFLEQEGHDVRDLYRTIATSILYVASSESASEDEADAPPWHFGPTKAMDATQFLDSVEAALEVELGFCDPHTSESPNLEWYFPLRLREPPIPNSYGLSGDYYLDTGKVLGGCQGGIPEPRSPGMPALFTHIDMADALCDETVASLMPAGFDTGDASAANLATLADHQFVRFLGRPAEAEEAEAVTTTAAGCEDQSCPAETYARELCGALLRSGTFLFY